MDVSGINIPVAKQHLGQNPAVTTGTESWMEMWRVTPVT
jgi:hypothetical protein